MAISNEQIITLIESALQAREASYSPYSNYRVGAAILTSKGGIYSGCNIENASYGGTICAERCTAFKAVSEGHTKFLAIAIVGGPACESKHELTGYADPCGMCRQVLREFCQPSELQVIVAKSTTDYRICTLEDLLPYSFGPDHLS